jgi:4'-phosphopantetheinyl transferase EntD
VVVEESDLATEVVPLYPEEAALVARAVASRQHEFAVGRHCARRALARLGVASQPLLTGPDRAPCWPEGLVGSITHTQGGGVGYCCAAVADRREVSALGIDAEGSEALDTSLWEMVLTAEEAGPLVGKPAGGRLAKIIFAAKEATYKAMSSRLGRVLDFAEVCIHLGPRQGYFQAELRLPEGRLVVPQGRCEGRFSVADDLVFAAVAAFAGPAPAGWSGLAEAGTV